MKSLSVCLVALFILLCVALGNATSYLAIPQPLAPCDGTNDCLWDLVTINGKLVKIVTISIDVTITTADPELLAAVVKAKAAGIFVFAKIKTNFGNRSLEDVKLEIDLCVKLYGVSGFVFDEVPAVCTCKTYYSDLYAYVKVNVAGLVVLNIGANVPECFALFADILVVFDSSYADYLKFVALPWYAKHPASLFWHNIHSCPKLLVKAALSLAIKLNAGFCYVTDKAADVAPSLLDVDLCVKLLGLLSLDLNLNLL
jgi:hypothetical protein